MCRTKNILIALITLALAFSPLYASTEVVTDDNGNDIKIPEEINRIIITSPYPLPSVFALYEGNVSRLVGMHPSSMAAARNSILADIIPEVVDVSTAFAEGGSINIEEIIALEPDIIFFNAENASEELIYRNAGIPAVGFSSAIFDGDAITNFSRWIDLFEQIFGAGGRGEEIVSVAKEVESFITERIASAKNLEKPRCLILFNYSPNSTTTSGNNHFGQFWIETAGGVNVAEALSGSPQINTEQIYEWNPDMIFITNFSPVLPEDLLNNTIEGMDWRPVKAVQEGKVYKFPLGMYRWYPPSSDTPLCLLWMAKTIHPEIFADVDMDQAIRDYYERFYNIEVTDAMLYRIYNPSRDAAYF